MRKVHFIQADVFSDGPFGGNPVVVVPDPHRLTVEEMQALARGMGIPETVFVESDTAEGAVYGLRCFTPTLELRYSGHGLLGAAFVLATIGRLPLAKPGADVSFRIGGVVHPVSLAVEGKEVVGASTRDCAPQFGAVFEDFGRVLRSVEGSVFF